MWSLIMFDYEMFDISKYNPINLIGPYESNHLRPYINPVQNISKWDWYNVYLYKNDVIYNIPW